MLMLNKEFLKIFKQVLKYLEKYYLPEKCNCYTDKFEMISDHKPIDDEELFSHPYIDFRKIDCDKKAEEIKQKKCNENMFCKNIITYLDNNLEQLKICCKKSQLTPTAFKRYATELFLLQKLACVI